MLCSCLDTHVLRNGSRLVQLFGLCCMSRCFHQGHDHAQCTKFTKSFLCWLCWYLRWHTVGCWLVPADEERNGMFKLIPHCAKGSWVVSQSVGTTPVILGRKLATTYHLHDRCGAR